MLTVQTLALAVAALAGIVLTILGGARLARMSGLKPVARRLRVVDQLSLGRGTLRIVACDGRELLVLSGAGADTMLGWLEPAR